MSHRKGQLRSGYDADLAILSQDLFSIPAAEIPATRSLMTVIDGKVAYEGCPLVDITSPTSPSR
jgi:hypothetical protein